MKKPKRPKPKKLRSKKELTWHASGRWRARYKGHDIYISDPPLKPKRDGAKPKRKPTVRGYRRALGIWHRALKGLEKIKREFVEQDWQEAWDSTHLSSRTLMLEDGQTEHGIDELRRRIEETQRILESRKGMPPEADR